MQSAEWYRDRAMRPSLTVAEKATIRQEWAKLMGSEFSASFNPGCPNCYHDAVILILRAMTKDETKSKYELKRGVVFKYHGKVYSSRNITDEAAEWWIKQDLKHRDDFITLAKDYDSYAGDAE